MIKLRLTTLTDGSSDRTLEYKENETLKELMDRVHEDLSLDKEGDHLQVLVNGLRVEKEFWFSVQIKESDDVLVAPKIKGGSFGEIFKTVAVIVVTVVASVLLTPAGGATIGSALAVAGVSIATSLVLNALIPPPVPGGLDLGSSGGNSFASSQMYSISSQSNGVKKFGKVPKVYGTHKVFPNVAASPYTEIETDPTTGELIQYFYAIYDFGFGPNLISDIKIGDSSIGSFSDASYSLVDLNKPTVSEGTWDDLTTNSFKFYKGEVEFDSVSTILEYNQVDGGALSGYEVVRTSSPNINNVSQEVIITFTNPNGLIAYATNGNTYARNIDVDIQFRKIGTTTWRNYNDLQYVEDFKAVGGNQNTSDETLALIPFNESSIAPYSLIRTTPSDVSFYDSGTGQTYTNSTSYYGFPKNSTFIVAENDLAVVGDYLFSNGTQIGKIASIVSYNASYSKYIFESPIPKALELFKTDNSYICIDFSGPVCSPFSISSSTNTTIYRKSKGRFTITRQDTGTVYSTVKFTPREIGQFEVKITRVRAYSSASFNVQDKLLVAGITTRFDSQPIKTDKRHTFLELRIKATNQLNGAIQNLSAVSTSVLDTWNGTTWTKQATNNPAWIFVDLMTGELNKNALPKTRLHLPSLLEWSQFCDQVPTAPTGSTFVLPRFQCNFILDFDTTLQSIINQVCSAGQASLNIVEGKYGVLIDKKRTVPVQIFTPRNSSAFSSTRNYSISPHALKVKYVDPSSDWSLVEKIVYDQGYDVNTAETFDELTSFACTNPEQAWRFGRYMMAQNRLRQETISIRVDFEFLVCNRGDFVQITQDVMKVGGTPARVKSVAGNVITIDEGIETLAVPYGYVARSTSGIVTNTLTVLSSDTFQLNGVIPSVGDLIVIGEVGSVVLDCIIKSITPDNDLTAQLILVEKADAIYDAESTNTIPNYTPQISRTADAEFSPPPPVEALAIVENSWVCGANSFEHYIKLDWDVPVNTAFEFFEVYYNDGRGYDLAGTTKSSEYIYYVDDSRLGFEHSFKVVAVSATGKKLDLATVVAVTATPERKTSRPMNIDSLSTNITGEVLQLDWEPVNDCIREYLIRYSPTLDGTWEGSIPLLRTDKNTTLASTQARTGTYLIKAIDFNDNESARATVAITTIPELFNLNVVSNITDFPTLVGAKDRVKKEGNTLILKNKEVGGVESNEYHPEGYYYYTQFLDLGSIYTVRLQSLIQAEGYTLDDIMSNWVTLSSLSAMANSRYSEWDVQTEYRTTESFNVMADWVNLTSINPISEGVQDVWSPWRRFTIGDGTGRIFQFRLKLISNKASVTPRVFDGTIKADMPDRIESYENLSATATGYDVVYTPSFKGPGTTPSIQITLENGESGDYWEFAYKNLDGFKIIFYDKNGVAVSRIFDAQVKGFGRKSAYVL